MQPNNVKQYSRDPTWKLNYEIKFLSLICHDLGL